MNSSANAAELGKRPPVGDTALSLTPEAKSDLKEILLDISEDSPDTGERLRCELYEALQRLGKYPGIGHYHKELLNRRYGFGISTPTSFAMFGRRSQFRLSRLCTALAILRHF